MSFKAARANYFAVSKPASSFDAVKALVWLALAATPWLALYLVGRHIF
jgi:hypothetical protein